MRAWLYDILALVLLAGGGAVFYRCIGFFAAEDYLAGISMIVVGFVLIRGGIDLGEIGLLARRDHRPER
jgi:hypothetical protein